MSRNFSNWIDTYLEYTKYSEAPDIIHYWAAVSAIAGAVRRQVWIDMGYWEWVPNFYIVIVAPPGIVSKSFTSGIAMDLLKQIKEVQWGPNSVTWQKMVMSLSRASKVFHTPDGRFLTQSAMTIAASEFGTFLDPQDRDMVDVMVDLWDSKPGNWTKANVGLGEFTIQNPCLNMIACTTPNWISSAFPEYMIGGGFTSRTVFVYADTKRQFVAYPGQQMVPERQKELRTKLIQDLTEISTCTGAMTLTPDAFALGEAWYEDFFKNTPHHLKTGLFDGYIARKQTHIHKLAMILSLSESNSRIVTADHLAVAMERMAEIEKTMPMVFENIGLSHAGKKANHLIRLLKLRGPLTIQELYAVASNAMSYQEFEESIKDLTQSKRIAIQVIDKQAKLIPRAE